MASPQNEAVLLEDVSAVIQQQYMTEFGDETPSYFGSTTNKLIKPNPLAVTGDGITLQVKHRRADNVRFGTVLGDITNPDTFQSTTIKARFNRNNSATNDFTQVTASVQTDLVDLQMKGKGAIVDFVQEIYQSIMGQYDETLAIHRHLGKNGVLAFVNGTPKRNDSYLLSSATSTATNANGLRVAVDNGNLASLPPGRRVDFIRPATGAVIAGNIEVTDRNMSDLSVGFQFNSTGITGRLSTGNLASVADNDYIVFSGMYNQNMYSIGAYFGSPTAGESFIGGVDRTTSAYRWLLPHRSRDGSASARISKSFFNNVAIEMGFIEESPNEGMVWLMEPGLQETLRNELTEAAFINIPVDDSRLQRFANFGSVGLNYQHAQFGLCKLMADPLSAPGVVRVLQPETWKALYVNFKGLQPIMENGAHWYRMSQGTPNTGKGLFYKADWFGIQTDWCMAPWKNACILNLTTS